MCSSCSSGSSSTRSWIVHGIVAGAAIAAAIGAGAYLVRYRKFRSQVVGIIPARYASSRFEGKPLVNILGKPMIQVPFSLLFISFLLLKCLHLLTFSFVCEFWRCYSVIWYEIWYGFYIFGFIKWLVICFVAEAHQTAHLGLFLIVFGIFNCTTYMKLCDFPQVNTFFSSVSGRTELVWNYFEFWFELMSSLGRINVCYGWIRQHGSGALYVKLISSWNWAVKISEEMRSY